MKRSNIDNAISTPGWQSLCILAMIGIFLMIPAFILGQAIGHSSVLNVNWAEGFTRQLAAGEFYPRWLPEMTGHGGSPVFYFYGPLPFYLAAPFVGLTGSAPIGILAAETTMLILSGVSCYALLRIYAAKQPSFLAALIYMALPYHFAMDIWYRSAFGEQAAYVFMPLSALCVLKLKDDWRYVPGLALSFSGLILSHLPSTVLYSPAMVILTVWAAWQEKSVVVIVRAGVAAVMAAGLSAIYLLPALSLQNMITASKWTKHRPEDHLFYSIGFLDDFSIFIVPVSALVVLFGILAARVFRDRYRNADILPWAILGAATILMISTLAEPFWLRAGFLRIVQFPWRALAGFDLCFVVVLAKLVDQKIASQRFLIGATVIVIGVGMAMVALEQFLVYHNPPTSPLLSPTREAQDYALKTDGSEYLPSCLKLPHSEDDNAMTRNFAIRNTFAPLVSGQPQVFYFPFLQAEQDGKVIPLTCDSITGLAAFTASTDGGRVSYTKLTLPVERWGAWISAASLLALLALAGLNLLVFHPKIGGRLRDLT